MQQDPLQAKRLTSSSIPIAVALIYFSKGAFLQNLITFEQVKEGELDIAEVGYVVGHSPILPASNLACQPKALLRKA